MDKRGQFFGLYLSFITLFMILTVIGIQYVQAGETESSLISPRVILELEDSMDVFERTEKELVLESLNSATGEFGTQEFINSFRSKFFSNLDLVSYDIIYSNLTFEGRAIEFEARNSGLEFLENILYPEVETYYPAEGMVFGRAEVGKSFVLRSGDSSNINFPIDFKYRYSKGYIIKQVNGEFLMG